MDNQEGKPSKISEWEKKHKNPYMEGEPSPIKQGEVFDPEYELKTIKRLPKSERKAALSVYKDKLDFQLHGFARLRDELIREMKNNRDFTFEGLRDIAYKYINVYGMTNTSRNIIEHCISDAYRRHKEVMQMRKDVPDDIMLCKEIFNFQPRGKVSISVGVLTLDIIFEDPKDFALAYFDGGEVTDDKISQISTYTRGFFVKISGIAARFNGKIIALNGKSDYQAVYTHEEQHVFHNVLSIVTEYPSYRPDLFKLSETSRSLKPGEKVDDIEKAELQRFFLTHRTNALMRIKDEILAYKKCNDREDAGLYYVLTAHSLIGGLYDYTYDMRKKMIDYYRDPKNTTEPAKNLVLNLMDTIMTDEYHEIIINAIGSINHLIEAGYTHDQAVNILSPVPLDQWRGTARRVAAQVGYRENVKDPELN